MTKMTQMHVRLEVAEQEAFAKKLDEEYSFCVSRSAVLRSWVVAYTEGRLRITDDPG